MPLAMMSDASARGASNRRRGIAYMQQVADYLRGSGWWPYATLENRHGSHDIFGVGDLGLEVTLDSWDQIAVKMIQAKRDAASRGLWRWAVIKKKKGQVNPASHYAVTEAAVFLHMAWQLERVDQLVTEWENLPGAATPRAADTLRQIQSLGIGLPAHTHGEGQ